MCSGTAPAGERCSLAGEHCQQQCAETLTRDQRQCAETLTKTVICCVCVQEQLETQRRKNLAGEHSQRHRAETLKRTVLCVCSGMAPAGDRCRDAALLESTVSDTVQKH